MRETLLINDIGNIKSQLKIMLQLKALLALTVGRLTKNTYLVKTYEHAYKITKMV